LKSISGFDINYQPTLKTEITQPTQDVEDLSFNYKTYGPAWQRSTSGKGGIKWTEGGTNSHVSTAYIRHATFDNIREQYELPMMSPWELGAIHRGSRWKTLNLSVSPSYTVTAPMTLASGGGSYADGDAPILDQIKMVDDLQVMGKINLMNSYTNENVKKFSLGALFYCMPYRSDGNYLCQMFKNDGNVLSTGIGTTKNNFSLIKSDTDMKYTTFMDNLDTVKTALQNKDNFAEKESRLLRRTDILVPSVAGTTLDQLRRPTAAHSDALREQIISRIINLTKVEDSIHGVKAVIIVQMIKDSGGGTGSNGKRWVRDWNNDGAIGGSVLITAADPVAQYQAGYRRFKDAADGTNPSNDTLFVDKSDNAYGMIREKSDAAAYYGQLGRYDIGADTISGEAKVVVSLVYDSANMKWKVQSYEFAE